MEICELKDVDLKAWDDFILQNPNATFYHQIGWKNVVEKTYGHKPCYLTAKENDEIIGVLPLFRIYSRLSGRKLISSPFAPYGGVCADNLEVEKALIKEAERIVNDEKFNSLEIRNFNKSDFVLDVVNDEYVTFVIDLDQGLDIVWEKMRKDKKKGVKKAKKSNVNFDFNSNDLKDFYDVHLKNMGDLGTPVHSYSFFQNILSEFPDKTTILTIKYNEITICSKFLLFFNDTVISMWGSTLKEYRQYHPYDLANWEAIARSHGMGYKYFDFGRCLKNSGVFEYKKGWGGKHISLNYQFYLQNNGKNSDFSQNNPKRKMFARVWREIPLSVTKRLGPKIRPNFP